MTSMDSMVLRSHDSIYWILESFVE